LDDEWAAEIANKTVHGVVHIGWVLDGTGRYRGQMAVLVKPNGLLGRAYMAAIAPFRHLIVYPAMMRQIERSWRTHARGSDQPSSLTQPASRSEASQPGWQLTPKGSRGNHGVPRSTRPCRVPPEPGSGPRRGSSRG
nr:DUF2867 domain-containing protein [Actinomycetota bacterium]